MIKSISPEGDVKLLILNESVIMASKSDTLSVSINEGSDDNFTANFKFVDYGKEMTTTSSTEELEKKVFNLTLHKWEGTGFVETKWPWEFELFGNKYWIQWRVFAPEKGHQRIFEISVWVKSN